MNPHIAAQHLAAQGRGQDSMLVHMEPKEVAGLESLARMHGGHLSVNPNTGLPEAGFLSDVIGDLNDATGGLAGPLVGIAGTAMGIPGLDLALGWGAANALSTGSLGKGLMAGLGAYGGAGIGESLMGAGTAAGLQDAAAASGSGDPIAEAANANMAERATPMDRLGRMGQGASSITGVGDAVTKMGGGKNLLMAGAPLLANMAGKTTTKMAPDPSSQFGGIKSLGHYDFKDNRFVPGGYAKINALGQQMGDPYDVPKAAEGGKVGDVQTVTQNPGGNTKNLPDIGAAVPDPNKAAMDYLRGGANPFSSQQSAGADQASQAPADPATAAMNSAMSPMNGAPSGGPGGFFGNANAGPFDTGQGSIGGGEGNPGMDAPYAEGGLAALAHRSNLGHYSDGGQLLKGPGDGVSDDIPAQIGEKQPARLADGEFVIPARIVSELGNGSTDAGARRLYQMMDRIQAGRAKTVGKNRVALDSKAERHLPA